jgi:photosystem II stability/assembly factor-like uncharacterized protein
MTHAACAQAGSPEVRTMSWAIRRGWQLMVIAIVVAAAGCGARAASPAADTHQAADTQGQAAVHPRLWFESVQMISAKAGWALLATSNPTAGKGAPLLAARTADGGRRWVTVGPAAIAGLAGEPVVLQAATPSRAWVAVYLPAGPGRHATTEVFSTDNGGASWSRSAPAGQAQPIAVDFVDPAHGWLLENLAGAMGQEWVAVYRTTDAGRRWSTTAQTLPAWPPQSGTSRSGLPTACDKSGMIFSTARVGWITSFCDVGGQVLVTHDAGHHWGPLPLPVTAASCPDGCDITPPQFIGQTGFLVVGRYPATGDLLVSRDGGSSWQVRQLPAGAGPGPQIRFFTADRGIAVPGGTQGLIGSVYVTGDGGQTWTPVPQGRHFSRVGTYLDFVSVRDGLAWVSSAGIASGPAPDMYVTTNSGRTWTAITPRQA